MYTIEGKLGRARALISVIYVIPQSSALAEHYPAAVIELGAFRVIRESSRCHTEK